MGWPLPKAGELTALTSFGIQRVADSLLFSLLFATTNHIERLDPALSRPGRMDVWVNFTHATKWQAEGIFKCFFPYKPSNDVENAPQDASQKNLPGSKRKASTHAIPLLSEDEISELAKRFAAAIPEEELSVGRVVPYFQLSLTIHGVLPGCRASRLFAEEQDSPA
jgi:SpoVK/Ycf46/Vps4 family AAA+-type ATPase